MSLNYQVEEVIRVKDPIYGEFEVREPFSKIIFTKEMRRLEDIGQNGFSIYDYPGLENNERLSHSLGAFFIMSKMIEQLECQLKHYGISISQDDKDMALCSMLLHDVGHGPFSHDCELITKYSHEKRTTDILLGDTEVNRILKSAFGMRKTKKIASYIAEINDPDSTDFQTSSFAKLIKSLISHQLDADRLDYLVRDAYYAGLKSSIDWKRIVGSLGVSVDSNQNYEALIDKEALSDIETILIERYQRYRDVYFSPTANIMKTVLPEVLKKYSENPGCVSAELPEQFKLFTLRPEEISLEEFLSLTDTPFLEAFDIMKENANDETLRKLCDFRNLNNIYQTLEEDVSVEDIREKLQEIFPDADLSNSMSVIENTSKIRLYKKEESLKINYGNRVKDVSEATNLIRPQEIFCRHRTFFSPEILRLELGMSKQQFSRYMPEIEKAIEELNRKPEEFKLKYIIPEKERDDFSIENVISVLSKAGIKLVEKRIDYNDDDYYDTRDIALLTEKSSLRIRKKANQKIKGAFKTTSMGQGDVFYSRDKSDVPLQTDSISELKEAMQSKGIDFDFSDIYELPILNTSTNRQNFILERDGVKICISFDGVTYTNHMLEDTQYDENMIQVEVLSGVNDRVILKEINSILNKEFPFLRINKQDKYERGVQKTSEKNKKIKEEERKIGRGTIEDEGR